MSFNPKELKAACEQDAWNKVASSEAAALVALLEKPDRKVMVVIIAAHSDADGLTGLIHAVSSGTKKTHGIQFHAALLKRARLLVNRIANT